jgi:hypothetical protein
MKIKCSRKTNIVLLSVAGTVIVLYSLTFFFGIRAVKLGHEAELRKLYAKTEAWYKTHPIQPSEMHPSWRKRFEKNKTFPTWEEFKAYFGERLTTEYIVVFPFLIKSETSSCEEYHLWYICGERLLKSKITHYY